MVFGRVGQATYSITHIVKLDNIALLRLVASYMFAVVFFIWSSSCFRSLRYVLINPCSPMTASAGIIWGTCATGNDESEPRDTLRW